MTSTTGASIVSIAESHEGSPYLWGGYLPSGWDCSGFVNYVLGNHMGMTLPGGWRWTGRAHGPIAEEYKVWSGATTVTTPAPGDLCCWNTHVGFYIGGGQMISALSKKWGTRTSPVTWGPKGEALTYRQIRAVDYTSVTGVDYATQVVQPAGSGCGVAAVMMPVALPYYLIRHAITTRRRPCPSL